MNNKKPDKKEIENKLNLVIDKLMNLGRPDNDEELEKGGESIGFFKRDFGIKEWDWPQGVGLYGLLKIMQINGNDEYREFLYKWFKENIAEGLPSKNINTTVYQMGRVAYELPSKNKGTWIPACYKCEWRQTGSKTQ